MEVVKLQILDGFLLPSLSLSEMRHLMLWIFLPLSRLLTAAAKFPASSFLLHDDNGLTDDLKIGPYQELLEQRSESERAADMRAAAEDAGGEPGAWHGPLCKAGVSCKSCRQKLQFAHRHSFEGGDHETRD